MTADAAAPGRTAPDAPSVLKFGGSTFATLDAYGDLARNLTERLNADGRRLAIVVSAMPGGTERLRERLRAVDPSPSDDRVAGLLTLADTVSAHLLAAALHRHGQRAAVLAGHQTGFTTEGPAMWARLQQIDPLPLRGALDDHDVVIVPGGQATDAAGRPTWLGKNSSDLSAVAVAVAVGATGCEIHSDVEGIYSSDPNAVPGARLLEHLSYSDAATISRYGAKVLHRGAVQLAERHGIALACRHNAPPFTPGTVIGGGGRPVDAVVLNLRSRVLSYPEEQAADQAHRALLSDGVDALRIEDGPRVAVIGGYADHEAVQRRHGLAPGSAAGIPVTEIRSGQPLVHVASDAEEAVRLANKLHAALPSPTPTGPNP